MKKKIYLAGAMTGLTFKELNGWREALTVALDDFINEYDLYNPIDHCLTEADEVLSPEIEHEVFEYNLYKLRRTDVVVANIGKNFNNSVETIFEIAKAHELKIPVIGYNKEEVPLHSWIKKSCIYITNNIADLAEYIIINF